jgi:flagellar hook-length control protein FliK
VVGAQLAWRATCIEKGVATAAIIPAEAGEVNPASFRFSASAQGDTFLALLASFLPTQPADTDAQQTPSSVSACDDGVGDDRDISESKSTKTKDADDKDSEQSPSDLPQLSGSAVLAAVVVPANPEFILVTPCAGVEAGDDEIASGGTAQESVGLATPARDMRGCFDSPHVNPMNEAGLALPASAPLTPTEAVVAAASLSKREEHSREIQTPSASRSEKSRSVSNIEPVVLKNANAVERSEVQRVLADGIPTKRVAEDFQPAAADIRTVDATHGKDAAHHEHASLIDPMLGREALSDPQSAQSETRKAVVSTEVQPATKKDIAEAETSADATIARPEAKRADGPSIPAATHAGPVLDSVRREPPSGPLSKPSADAVTSRPEADAAFMTASPISSREVRAVHETEVRIAWRSEQLGRVDIHAEVEGRNVSAALRVENEGARQFLTSEMPRTAEALRGHEFTVNALHISSFGSNSSPSDGGAQQDGGHARRSRTEREEQEDHAECTAQDSWLTTTHRVSIHV